MTELVMPGLVPGIHVLASVSKKDVDGRDKPGHDEREILPKWFAEACGRQACYSQRMSNPKQPGTKAKKKSFVIGRAGFARICAVEGIRVTPAMEKRASDAQRKGLSAEEYRETIMRAYREV